MSSTSAFTGFTKLSTGAYLRKGSSETDVPDDQPACILLCSWMGGAPQHIAKYTDAYSKVYPKSSLLLVTSAPAIFSSSQRDHDRQLNPIVTWLQKSGLLKQQGNRLLVHLMSNGGAVQASRIAQLLKAAEAGPAAPISRDAPKAKPIQPALPARAYVFDSLPGKGTWTAFLRAFTAPVAKASWFKKLPYYIVLPIIYCLSGFYWKVIKRVPNPIEQTRRNLLDPSLYKHSSPKVYIYSNTDELIEQPHVEEHMADSKRLGGPVEGVLIKRSAHVSHMRTDPDRYWKAIKDVYARGQ